MFKQMYRMCRLSRRSNFNYCLVNDVAILEECEDDFDSKLDYDEAILITKAFGCDCK